MTLVTQLEFVAGAAVLGLMAAVVIRACAPEGCKRFRTACIQCRPGTFILLGFQALVFAIFEFYLGLIVFGICFLIFMVIDVLCVFLAIKRMRAEDGASRQSA
jgi:hypothetical protein